MMKITRKMMTCLHTLIGQTNKDMDYKHSPKPTKYNGTIYRSRLEARWAAFFELIGWEYEYEPIDFDGWSPDFRVTTPLDSWYFEIKPDFVLEKWESWQEPLIKMENATDCDRLVLISRPFPLDPLINLNFAGLVTTRHSSNKGRDFCTGYISYFEEYDRMFITDCDELRNYRECDLSTSKRLWREAGNKVMFLPPIK